MAFPSGSAKAEYQHFVPQFLLRNFSSKYKQPKNSSGRKPKQGHGEARRIYHGEPIVSHVNLTADELAVEVIPVRRVMGMYNMYEDLGQATAKQRRHIEDMFGGLEKEASPIFRKIIEAVEQGDVGLWLSREDRNILRRFLFLLMYRSSQSHRRFHHATPDEYNSDDEIELYQYMLDRGFDGPMDVWFDNLKAIAECNMDSDGQWMEDIQARMYPPDARWFCHHTQQSYMAFCSPSDADAEFILAENSYSVYERIDSFLVDPTTGAQTGGPWVNFHYFAPISPKVVIVLRSNLLPVPEEDFDDEIREERNQWRSAAVDQWFGAGRQSGLADLPIAKARNNYTELIDGQLRKLQPNAPMSGGDGFFFKFFRINNDHVTISQIAKGEILSRHIYNTAMNSIEKDEMPGLNTWEAVKARDSERRVWMNKFVSRSEPIFRCGLPGVKELAAKELAWVFQHGVCREAEARRHIFDYPMMVELSVRMRLRARFAKGAMQGLEALSGSALQVWFDITYPTPPVLAAQ
ncbi:hypothetical protein INS49_000064 [Diaporthe citri]|uniref:uncharacterized protein n=1 Tax=Diaporthe citri TaxID=83186 RepID=UPI001C81AD4F|nr:uncharacterized protein INS49_000064 [Diaporthe citri]KAG6365888.1 hypothetical protein INS49_000064 [Diaporthe citri]